MSRFLPYNPEQAYLLPPSVKDELGVDHLCFFIRDIVRGLDVSAFEEAYSQEGGVLYAPELRLNVWLYGYALGITSARLMERRMGEDLAFRYLAGGARVDNWARSDFRRRHGRGINDSFTQVLEWAGQMGWARPGRAVIDSTRGKASACRDRVDTEQKLRNERAKLRRQVRRWQKACDRDDREPGGLKVAIRLAEEKLAEIPRRRERLRKTGMQKLSRTDVDARFLRRRGPGFELGDTAEVAVSDDHCILAQRVTQNATDNQSWLPLVDAVEQPCGTRPSPVLADSGFFSVAHLEELARRGIDG
jgi:transposase